MPHVYIFAFTFNLILNLIWLGVPIGVFVSFIEFAFILLSLNWNDNSIKVYQRINDEKSQLKEHLIEK